MNFKLNKSEEEVYRLLLKGYRQKEIAKIRGVKYSTVRKQADNIYTKLLVNSQVELLAKRIEELENELSQHTNNFSA